MVPDTVIWKMADPDDVQFMRLQDILRSIPNDLPHTELEPRGACLIDE